MKTATVKISSVSPMSQSRPHNTPKKDKEAPDDYERRTWRERCHANPDGSLFTPPMAFKLALAGVAKFLGTQIKGRGKSTYTKHYEAGVLVMDAPILMNGGGPIMKDDVEEEWLFMNADGVRGSGKRVWKCYPKIPEWHTEVVFYILDDTITEDVFEFHLNEAGKFQGIGRFRPINGGFYGRFKVDEIRWEEQE